MIPAMKRLAQFAALAAIVFSLDSCSLPAVLGRSAGRLMDGVASVANAGQ